jgi:hypothetical protein
MAENVLIPSANVEGNITSCKIENQLIKTDRASVFSVQEIETYATYDVCSKQIIQQYTIPSLAPAGDWLIAFAVAIAVVGVIIGFVAGLTWLMER